MKVVAKGKGRRLKRGCIVSESVNVGGKVGEEASI